MPRNSCLRTVIILVALPILIYGAYELVVNGLIFGLKSREVDSIVLDMQRSFDRNADYQDVLRYLNDRNLHYSERDSDLMLKQRHIIVIFGRVYQGLLATSDARIFIIFDDNGRVEAVERRDVITGF